ncbi:MAG TPA: hypothetical protein PLG20_04555 [Candidatus Syntrophosphaera sp.]|nr:hypothetical protein [Candidatus Syntrophosphaera sp.]
MMEDKKKELAAIGGVLALLDSEAEPGYPHRPLENAPSVWQAYGRQQTMQYRDTVQRRLIKRSR